MRLAFTFALSSFFLLPPPCFFCQNPRLTFLQKLCLCFLPDHIVLHEVQLFEAPSGASFEQALKLYATGPLYPFEQPPKPYATGLLYPFEQMLKLHTPGLHENNRLAVIAKMSRNGSFLVIYFRKRGYLSAKQVNNQFYLPFADLQPLGNFPCWQPLTIKQLNFLIMIN